MENFIYTAFGEITQLFIKSTSAKKNTSVLALIIFYEIRSDNPKKYFRVLSCVIYTIIKNYVCIDYLACQSKKLSEITVVYKEGSKHGEKGFNIIKFCINKGDRTSHWVGHSDLKELYNNELFERKHMIEDMEAELTKSSEIDSKTGHLAVNEEADFDEDILIRPLK